MSIGSESWEDRLNGYNSNCGVWEEHLKRQLIVGVNLYSYVGWLDGGAAKDNYLILLIRQSNARIRGAKTMTGF